MHINAFTKWSKHAFFLMNSQYKRDRGEGSVYKVPCWGEVSKICLLMGVMGAVPVFLQNHFHILRMERNIKNFREVEGEK